MEELVFKSEKGTPVTTSLLVAQKFGKEHKDVLEIIRNLTTAENSAFVENKSFRQWFYLTEQQTPMPVGGGFKNNPIYVMNRDGFTLLVMGFTGREALRFKIEYIDAFNKMEQELKQSILLPNFNNPAEAARAWAQEYEQKQVEHKKRLEAESIIETQAPKVLFADAVATSNRSVLISELAKILKQNRVEIGQNRLFIWLRNNGYLCNKGEYYNQPTQKAMQLGLFEIKKTTITKPDGSILVSCTTKVTGKGQIYFTNKFLKKPVLVAN